MKGRRCQCYSWARLATFDEYLQNIEGRIILFFYLRSTAYWSFPNSSYSIMHVYQPGYKVLILKSVTWHVPHQLARWGSDPSSI